MSNANHAPFIVTISGDLGSGKSRLAQALAGKYGADRYSTGSAQRELADKLGITTLELNQRAETDPTIDEQIDGVFKNLANTSRNLIVDSRMAWHFLPRSFKIKLEVHPDIAAERVAQDTTRFSEGPYKTTADIAAALKARKASERERFLRYYGVDIDERNNYDLVINTTDTNPAAVVTTTEACLNAWLAGHSREHVWMAPHYILPHADWRADAPIAANEGNTIIVERVRGFHMLLAGQKLLDKALKNNDDLVPVLIVNTNNINTLPKPDQLDLWQKLYNFTFQVRP